MSTTSTNGTPVRRLNIGIYGCRQAGKTRFLYQLLGGWHQAHRLLTCSPNCHAFLSTVEAQIATYGRSTPTVAKSEGLAVEVRRDGKGPPWKLTLRDLQGEVLADELDVLAETVRQGVIPEQVRECNAFLFFFDPTSADDPDHREDHYRREKKRAELFIDFVLRTRENRHLPIVFILTRLDLWEDDTEVKTLAGKWIDEVNELLRERYREVLLDHHPDSLTDPKKTALAISSVRGQEVEPVIERLDELVDQTTTFARGSRRGMRWLVAAGAALAVLFVGYLVFSLFFDPSLSASPGGGVGVPTDLVAVPSWSADRVRKELDVLDQALAAHPAGGTLPRVEQARQLNWPLRWLPIRLSTAGNLTPELSQRLENAWRQSTELVRSKAESDSGTPEDRAAVLEAYLDDVYAVSTPSPDLLAAQAAYWDLLRRQIVDQVATLLKKHEDVASDPKSALDDVQRELGQMEQRIKSSKVSHPEKRKALLEDVQTTAAFCESRRAANHYQAKFRIVSGQLTSSFGIALNRRRLSVISPRKDSLLDLDIQVEKISDTKGRLKAAEKSQEVKLPLGQPGSLQLSIRPDQRDEWDVLNTFAWPTNDKEPSLKALGMPFVRAKPDPLIMTLPEWSGYQLTVELSELPATPPLLADALNLSGGKKP